MKSIINITNITMYITNGMDELHIEFDGKSPLTYTEVKPQLQLAVTKGYGLQYCKENFSIEPTVIDISSNKRFKK